ncbi:MAG: hypothetical protein P9L97_05875 [Candidatus Tenebribacter davisii]|nr:hypothetical protein [Candidatus Tenebribacter davisii]
MFYMWISWLSEDNFELGNHSYPEKEWNWYVNGRGLMYEFNTYGTMNIEKIWCKQNGI